MPKYIDADKFLLDNDYFADRDFINPRYSTTLRDLVDAAPAADVEPKRKTGWWKRIQWVKDEDWQEGGYWILRCSECVMPYHNPTLYCPHCGARMMSEDEIADGIGQTFSPD